MITLLINMFVAPLLGGLVQFFGERRALVFEYAGLCLVFFAYGGIYYFGWGVVLATVLYVVNHLFFSLALAIKKFFDPDVIVPMHYGTFPIFATEEEVRKAFGDDKRLMVMQPGEKAEF